MYAICSHCYGSKNTAASALPLAPLFPFVYKISGWYCGGCLCALLRRVLAFFAGLFFLFFFVHIAINLKSFAKYCKNDGARAWEPAKGRTIRSNAEMRQMNASESVYKPVYK